MVIDTAPALCGSTQSGGGGWQQALPFGLHLRFYQIRVHDNSLSLTFNCFEKLQLNWAFASFPKIHHSLLSLGRPVAEEFS